MNRLFHAMPQHYRRAMTGNLYQVLRRVRMRSLEERNDHLIDARFQRSQIRPAILKAGAVENRVRDVARLFTG
jgi:hypothetical protein